jgi:hypothetical protein
MENEDHKKIERYNFLVHDNAQEQFAKLDYNLKNGTHIQDKNHQKLLYRFIVENYDPLKYYYLDFFKLTLNYSGEEPNKYYFLEFQPEIREGVPQRNRLHLKPEYVIIAFLLYKIVYVDGNVELSSVKEFQRIVRNDYEDLKPDLVRLFAKVKELKSSDMTDTRIDQIIESAIEEYALLGWLARDEDYFDLWPSFQRIYTLYSPEIESLFQTIKQSNQ